MSPRQPPSRAVENLRLIALFQAGDARAGDELVKLNSGLVAGIARKYLPAAGTLEFADLEQEGRLGLLTAARGFNPARGFAFSSYAVPWIRQGIGRAIDNQSMTVRLPVLRRQQALREGADGRLHTLLERPLSLDFIVGDDEEDRFEDFLADSAPGPEEIAVSRLRVRQLLGHLDEKERVIISARFGLDEGPQRTLAELASQLHYSRERIRQIELHALKKLKRVAA